MFYRNKIGLAILIVCCFHLLWANASLVSHAFVESLATATSATEEDSDTSANNNLYKTLNLAQLGLSKTAFDKGMEGYDYFVAKGIITNKTLTIVDFSKLSTKKRLFVIDMKEGKLLFNTYVAHGQGSGLLMATAFGNIGETHKSSLGFYLTGKTLESPKHGFALYLYGQEKGINDNAYNREIIMHSAPYVSDNFIKKYGYLGRSWGCPAVPIEVHQAMIEKIKEGSCLFVYSPDMFYAIHSAVLKKAG